MKNKFYITITILASLMLYGCLYWDNNYKSSSEKQQIIQCLTAKIKTVEPILTINDDPNWNESAQNYNISTHNQLFSYIEDTQNMTYNFSEKARREVYLALEYKKEYIESLGKIFDKIVRPFNLAIDNQRKALIENALKEIRTYGKNYYIEIFTPLSAKKDNLDSLSTDKLAILKTKLDAIMQIKENISQTVKELHTDYNTDKEVVIPSKKYGEQGVNKKLKSVADSDDLFEYIKAKTKNLKSQVKAINNSVSDIQNILKLF
ncbi:virulence associated lipoprotein [Borrelia miyamotoi]|uniref:virulence associated lipoprotein n=1 Tax=Borrelia miyamotoi TaxID=47466 RepID=UPI00087DA09B|nr:virulence associated lipoprotein [Borrelia miyamotoi]AOW96348.1 hypothetical protein AXH25_04240 [Borrelia miyamotoi]QTL84068.1 hypothetical protein bmLB2001_001142 [Borrelia miyamotoi]WAZ85770.1 virulence associated lipoprotein [Borrelia miyamotoi]WAZ92840.1 virulence associated lipoprotein [Borrelia miyamotoi]WAZ96703.1 virulence associated lipoprotein [Borrelia miyamotoi]